MSQSPTERSRAWRLANPEKSRASSRKYYANNVEKCRAATARSRERHPQTEIAGHLKRKYNLTLEEYGARVERQGGLCMLCRKAPPLIGKWKRLVVDHDHETKKIRDLLCHRCNVGLGAFLDDVQLLEAAIQYVAKHKENG